MNIMGIDPGATTGWCLYDAIRGRALASGQFPGADVSLEMREQSRNASVFVIERPMGYGPTYPQVVDAAWYGGQLATLCSASAAPITRREIKAILTEATQGDVRVKDDATAWAALKLLHGGESSAKKGGPLYGIKAHERAALAVAVAFAIKQASVTEVRKAMQ